MAEEKKEVKLALESDEIRFIAMLRAIKLVNKPSLVAPEDAGVALSLLQLVEGDLEQLEKDYEPERLRTFLRGYITGLAASKVQEMSYFEQSESRDS